MPPKSKRQQTRKRPYDRPASPTDPPFEPNVITEPVIAQANSANSSGADPAVLQLLVDLRRDQLSQHEQMQALHRQLASTQKHANRQPAPTLQSKSFAAQYQFNSYLRTLVSNAEDSLHDPDASAAILKSIDAKLADRNKSLHLADSIPGALTAIDKAKELEGLVGSMSDSVVASLLPQLLQNSRPAVTPSRNQPFLDGGSRFQGPPHIQYPFYPPMQESSVTYPYQEQDIP